MDVNFLFLNIKMKIASFTQTYGDKRFLNLQLLQHDTIGNDFRNRCDIIVFSFHNCAESFVAKSTELLQQIYPKSKLQILIHNDVQYLESIQKSLLYLKGRGVDYILQIQDDQHGVNTIENLKNMKNIGDIFKCLDRCEMDYLHIFENEGNKEFNRLTPKVEISIENTKFYSYDSRDFKNVNIYAWNDGTYFAKIKFMDALFGIPNLPQDVWGLELALKAIFDQHAITRWGIDKLYFKASNLYGSNVNTKLTQEDNLKRFFGELPSWEKIRKMLK